MVALVMLGGPMVVVVVLGVGVREHLQRAGVTRMGGVVVVAGSVMESSSEFMMRLRTVAASRRPLSPPM